MEKKVDDEDEERKRERNKRIQRDTNTEIKITGYWKVAPCS
jgi:hypothetical protein